VKRGDLKHPQWLAFWAGCRFQSARTLLARARTDEGDLRRLFVKWARVYWRLYLMNMRCLGQLEAAAKEITDTSA